MPIPRNRNHCMSTQELEVKISAEKRFSVAAKGGYCAASLPDFQEMNAAVSRAYLAIADDASTRRSHYFHGRYENVYVEAQRIPALAPVVEAVLLGAQAILGADSLRYGFWFNEMAPGHLTTRHNHDDLDELLSCVYYIDVPADSGDLLLHYNDEVMRIPPQAGRVIYFDPAMDHEVTINNSDQTRLSVAFNFGLSC